MQSGPQRGGRPGGRAAGGSPTVYAVRARGVPSLMAKSEATLAKLAMSLDSIKARAGRSSSSSSSSGHRHGHGAPRLCPPSPPKIPVHAETRRVGARYGFPKRDHTPRSLRASDLWNEAASLFPPRPTAAAPASRPTAAAPASRPTAAAPASRPTPSMTPTASLLETHVARVRSAAGLANHAVLDAVAALARDVVPAVSRIESELGDLRAAAAQAAAQDPQATQGAQDAVGSPDDLDVVALHISELEAGVSDMLAGLSSVVPAGSDGDDGSDSGGDEI